MYHLLRYLAQLLHSLHSTADCKVTPSYVLVCSIVRSLVYATFQLLRPICLLLGHTLSISGGTINDVDVPGIQDKIYFIVCIILD